MSILEWLIRPRSQPRIISAALASQVARGRPSSPAMPRVPLMARPLQVKPKDPLRLVEATASRRGLRALDAYDDEVLDLPEFLRAAKHEETR